MPWVVAIAAALALAALFGGGAMGELLAAIHGRGSRVGPATKPDGLGVIRVDPWGLATAAGLDLDTYAVARMLSSEEGNSPGAYKVAVAFAVVNASSGFPADKLLAGKGDAAGFFARQDARYSKGGGATGHAGKYASTVLDPRADDVTIARAVVSREVADPTGGATNFFRPGLQDDLFADGRTSKDAATVDASWRAGGLVRVDVDGVGDDLAFYREG